MWMMLPVGEISPILQCGCWRRFLDGESVDVRGRFPACVRVVKKMLYSSLVASRRNGMSANGWTSRHPPRRCRRFTNRPFEELCSTSVQSLLSLSSVEVFPIGEEVVGCRRWSLLQGRWMSFHFSQALPRRFSARFSIGNSPVNSITFANKHFLAWWGMMFNLFGGVFVVSAYLKNFFSAIN